MYNSYILLCNIEKNYNIRKAPPTQSSYEYSVLRAPCSCARQIQFHAGIIVLAGLLLIEQAAPTRYAHKHSTLHAPCSYARQIQFHTSMIVFTRILPQKNSTWYLNPSAAVTHIFYFKTFSLYLLNSAIYFFPSSLNTADFLEI